MAVVLEKSTQIIAFACFRSGAVTDLIKDDLSTPFSGKIIIEACKQKLLGISAREEKKFPFVFSCNEAWEAF